MARLSQLTRQHPVSVTLEYEDESLTVVFDRNKITRNWARKIQQAIATDNVDEAVYESTLDLMISWDVEDEQGNPLPPSMEILSALPIAAFERLSEAIGTAAAPTSEEGNASSNTSPTPSIASSSKPESPPNGQPTSSSPAPSESLSPT